MRYILRILVLILITITCKSNYIYSMDSYQIGDSLFVWAKSGLKLWEKPTTESKLIEVLPFGQQIIVSEKTSSTFNLSTQLEISTDYTSKSTQPLILKGKWVKIKCIKTQKIGYLADQYLLKEKPRIENIDNQILMINDNYVIDTIQLDKLTVNGHQILEIHKKYFNGTEVITKIAEKGNFKTIRLKKHSIEEAFILTANHWINSKKAKLIQNWRDQLVIYDGEMCEFYYSFDKYSVIIEITCSC